MPMEALLNALMAIGLLLVLILIIYLIDRVNSIESETRKVVNTLNENAARLATPTMGLSGKKLWDFVQACGSFVQRWLQGRHFGQCSR
jgi:hypothetical protein